MRQNVFVKSSDKKQLVQCYDSVMVNDDSLTKTINLLFSSIADKCMKAGRAVTRHKRRARAHFIGSRATFSISTVIKAISAS